MFQGNYPKILEKIALSSGLEKEEVERRIEAKRAKLSGLISKEGAAQIIAAELGINFDNEKLKIEELLLGMKKVNVVGQVINLFPVRNFVRNGKEGKVANLIIADDTGNVKVVLWDVNHIQLIENGKIREGSVIEIINGSVRDNEIHLGSFSELKQSDEKFSNLKTEKIVKEKKILEFTNMDNIKTRAFIVQIFDLRFFEVCPECKKKPIQTADGSVCNEHGKILPEKRALLNVVLDDGTETIRAVFFHDNLKNLGFNNLENFEEVSKIKQELLGKEMFFSGQIRQNKMFNNLEFVVNSVENLNLQELMQKLENK